MITTQVLGDICLSHAMKIYGEITSFAPSVIIDVLHYIFTSHWFYLSLLSLTISWFLYLFCVSKMDLSYVLPIHSSSYILNALLAALLLHEVISSARLYATASISVGVFIVGYGKYRQEKKAKLFSSSSLNETEKNNHLLLVLPTGVFLPLMWLGVIMMVLADTVGDILNARGMRQIETLNSFSITVIFKWVVQIFTNLNIIIGILSQILALFLFMCLLSWGDLSFIRPASAVSYIITIIFAKYIFQEQISSTRLTGIGFILVGVLALNLG